MLAKLLNFTVLIIFSQFCLAEITISVDRDPIVADESFQLIFESDKQIDVQPDFSPLKNTLTVLSSYEQMQTISNNGKDSYSKKWILKVVANKTGKITIPSIKIGKETTPRTSINVVKNENRHGDVGIEDVILDVNVSTLTPYVQAQIVYTVKLYRSIVTSNATLTEPKVYGGQAIINKLDDDKSYEVNKNGKRYVVIERRYVMFPQSSGELIIEPIIFQGQAGRGGVFGFDPFGPPPKSIVKRSNDIRLNVKPIPESFTGTTWLPASELTIQEQWSIDPGKLKQGEATTRTLTLQANGLAASHLPSINNAIPDNLKQYPDQPEFEEASNGDGHVGIRRDKMAIIPTEAGDQLLPAIKIPWWNTVTDKMEIAELPERSIHVEPNAGDSSSNISEPVTKTDINTITQEENERELSGVIEAPESASKWKWVSLALFVIWLITMLFWWRSNKKSGTTEEIYIENTNKIIAKRRIREACRANDPVMVKETLLEWSRVNWPDENISSLSVIKKYSDEHFQQQLDILNRNLYGKDRDQWDGEKFLKVFETQAFKQIKKIELKGKLQALYKT